MNEELIMTRDIHNFVRGRMNMEEGVDLIEKVAQSDEWIEHLLFDIYLFEIATSNHRNKLNDDLDFTKLGIVSLHNGSFPS